MPTANNTALTDGATFGDIIDLFEALDDAHEISIYLVECAGKYTHQIEARDHQGLFLASCFYDKPTKTIHHAYVGRDGEIED